VRDDAAVLRDVVDLDATEERRRALRALLRRPLLTAAHPAFSLVRRHAAELAAWFAQETGWALSVGTEVARLRKVPARTSDPTRPARTPRSGQPFSRRRYILLCLALAVLERTESQTTLGQLADRVLDAAGDPALRAEGFTFRLDGREERADLVAVVRLLLELGALARVAGDEEAYVRDTGDVLYDVSRRVLAGILAAPRGPSTVRAGSFEERLTALVAEPVPDTDEARTRAVRRSLTRRLLDDPVLYLDDLSDAERAYLVSQRAATLRRVADATGLEAESRAEGMALLDPTGEATDLGMPEDGTEGHVTLLLAEHLAATGTAATLEELRARTVALVAEHGRHWRQAAREPGADVALCAQAVDKLRALDLVRVDGDRVTPRPALARFAVDEPRLSGNPA